MPNKLRTKGTSILNNKAETRYQQDAEMLINDHSHT